MMYITTIAIWKHLNNLHVGGRLIHYKPSLNKEFLVQLRKIFIFMLYSKYSLEYHNNRQTVWSQNGTLQNQKVRNYLAFATFKLGQKICSK